MVLSNKRKINKKGLKSKLTKKKRNVVRKTRKYVRKIKGGGWNYAHEKHIIKQIQNILKNNSINDFTVDDSINTQIESLQKDEPNRNKYDDFIKLINDIITEIKTYLENYTSKSKDLVNKKTQTKLSINSILTDLNDINTNIIKNNSSQINPYITTSERDKQLQEEKNHELAKKIKEQENKQKLSKNQEKKIQEEESLFFIHDEQMKYNPKYRTKYQDELNKLNLINQIPYYKFKKGNVLFLDEYISKWYLYFNDTEKRKKIYDWLSSLYENYNISEEQQINLNFLLPINFRDLGFHNEKDYKIATDLGGMSSKDYYAMKKNGGIASTTRYF